MNRADRARAREQLKARRGLTLTQATDLLDQNERYEAALEHIIETDHPCELCASNDPAVMVAHLMDIASQALWPS